ncbi:hypothetical protein [Paenibacillus selenitireducens]|nr:hypothetical protein [Paenibacillus selenitireducens]
MPINKSEKIHNQQNKSRLKEEAVTPNPEKQSHRPASLNNIPK